MGGVKRAILCQRRFPAEHREEMAILMDRLLPVRDVLWLMEEVGFFLGCGSHVS